MMRSIVQRKLDEISLNLNMPDVRIFVHPKDYGGLIVLHCQHPRQFREVAISQRIGERHLFLLARRGSEWALRRVEWILRVLLKRLVRELEV